MKRLELPEQWEKHPDLRRHIGELMLAGRRRTAMDTLLQCLRDDAENIEFLYLALMIVDQGRTARLQTLEPITQQQISSALLAPIMTECSNCYGGWYSTHTLLMNSGTKDLRITNPIGTQCQVCRYTLCRDCRNRQMQQSHTQDIEAVEAANGPCPANGCRGGLTWPVLPTGRHDVRPMDPDGIEGVVVARDGIIPPTIDEALVVATRFLPLIPDDAPLIHIRGGAPGLMSEASTRDDLALTLVHELERDGLLVPGAWARSRRIHVLAGTAADTDYLITVVQKSGSPLTSAGAANALGGSTDTQHSTTTYTYVVLTHLVGGGWGRPNDPDWVGLVSVSEPLLPTIAGEIMTRIAAGSGRRGPKPRWRVVFYDGDRRKDETADLPDAHGFVDEGSEQLSPMTEYDEPRFPWNQRRSSQRASD